jgi:CRISPR/Cas system-associated exonuclease Cas4 (RecB family)
LSLSLEVIVNVSLAALRKKPHTSASALKTFLSCPRQYFFRYEERAVPAFRSASLAFGHAFHASVGVHLMKSSLAHCVPLEELVETFRQMFLAELAESFVPVLFDDEEQTAGAMIDSARQMLAVFVEQYPLPTRVLGVEVPFELVLHHPKTDETVQLPLVGAMDVIAQFDAHRRVLELKTGKRKWSDLQVGNDLQPSIYRKAAKNLGHRDAEVELVVITKAKKPSLHRLPCARSQRDEIELVELALSVERAVSAGVDFRRRDWQCGTCAYAAECSP